MTNDLVSRINSETKRRKLSRSIARQINHENILELEAAISTILERYARSETNITAVLEHKERLLIHLYRYDGRTQHTFHFPVWNPIKIPKSQAVDLRSDYALFELSFGEAILWLDKRGGEEPIVLDMPDRYLFLNRANQRFFNEDNLVVSIRKGQKFGRVTHCSTHNYGSEFNGVPLILVYYQNRDLTFNLDGDFIPRLDCNQRKYKRASRRGHRISAKHQSFSLEEERKKATERLIQRWREDETDLLKEGSLYLIQGEFIRTVNRHGSAIYFSTMDDDNYVGRDLKGKDLKLILRGRYLIVYHADQIVDSIEYQDYVSYKNGCPPGMKLHYARIKQRDFSKPKISFTETPYHFFLYTSKVKKELEGHDRAAVLIEGVDGSLNVSLLVLRQGTVDRYDLSDKINVYEYNYS